MIKTKVCKFSFYLFSIKFQVIIIPYTALLLQMKGTTFPLVSYDDTMALKDAEDVHYTL